MGIFGRKRNFPVQKKASRDVFSGSHVCKQGPVFPEILAKGMDRVSIVRITLSA